ncbi:MAG: hypothetical protein L6V95_06330 [Candidatus Melainabacteria bacterium]|nr:MAG: hypothetical protein L6V95_06330 [Candidatus Melainabacteria bacterium]
MLFNKKDDVFLYDFNCQNAVKTSDLEKIINKPIKILNKSEVLNIVHNATKDKKLTIVCGSFLYAR